MSYINSDGNNGVIASARINFSGNRYIERTSDTKTTYYYYPSGQLNCGIQVSFGYSSSQSAYYCMYYDGSTMTNKYIYKSSGKFSFSVKGGSSYEELITPTTADGSHGDTDFRTKLHCDLPKSNCGVSYSENATYKYYIDNTLITTTNSNNFMNYLTFANSNNSTSESGSFSPGTSGSKKWSVSAYASVWNYTSHIHKVANSNDNAYYNFSLSGSSFNWNGNGLTSGGTISKRGIRSCQYHYEIDGTNLNNTSELQFQADGITWTGLTSPYFSSDLDGWYCMMYPNSNFTTIMTEPQFTTPMGAGGGQWNVSPYSSLPTTIGNVTCLNPWKINNYTQAQSDTRGGQEPQEVRNNIFKIMPKFNASGGGLLSFATTTITEPTWEAHNCTITNNEVIATGENAYISQDYFRPIYSGGTTEQDPQGILNNTEYRQRHFTHFRYLQSFFAYKDIDAETYEEYTPDIDLIYLPCGNSGHTWKAKFNPAIGYYDLLNCNIQATSSTDEYASTCMPEFLKLHSPNVTYVSESPMTSYGYLPNIVGRIKIPIPQGKVVKIGDINSVYLPNYVTTREPVDGLPDWEGVENLIEYDSDSGGFSSSKGKIYIHSETEPTSFTCNGVELTETYQVFSNVSSATFTIVDNGYTYSITKNFSPNAVVKARKYSEPLTVGNEYGIEWYYIIKDDDEEYEENDGIWYRLRRHDVGFNIEIGSEFQEPTYYGLHQPKEEGMPGFTIDYYQNRFLVCTINGARSFEIPEVERKVEHHERTDDTETWLPVDLGQCKTVQNNPGARYIFHRDDLGEITISVTDSQGENKPISDMFFGSGAYINWLTVYSRKEIVPGGTNYWRQDVKIVPRFDTLSGSELYRFINNGNSTLRCKGDFGAVFSGINNIDAVGAITDESDYNNSKSLSFGTNTYYTHKLHGTKDSPKTEISLTSSNKKRIFDKVVDGCKYWWSVGISIGTGFIWRNSQGNILRNSQNKILRGHGYDNNP